MTGKLAISDDLGTGPVLTYRYQRSEGDRGGTMSEPLQMNDPERLAEQLEGFAKSLRRFKAYEKR